MDSEEIDDEAMVAEAKAELGDLVGRAKSGDATAIPRLREYLKHFPVLWKRSGDISLHAQAAWIRLIAGSDRHLEETLVMRLNALKNDLDRGTPTPLECLLIERVATSWLQVCYAEAHLAQVDETSIKWAEFNLKRLKTMHDMHLKSLAALATVRRLLPKADAPLAVDAPPKPDEPKDAASVPGEQEVFGAEDLPEYSPLNRIATLLGSKAGDSAWQNQ